jgi:hypothetical protein
MVIESHEMCDSYNLIAAISNWLFLAGFTFIPGTFSSISRVSALDHSEAGKTLQDALNAAPLLVIGTLCCFAGSIGIFWVYWKVRSNYVWLIDRVFL